MNEKQHSQSEKLWAFVHGEISTQDRAELQQAIDRSEPLQRELDTVRLMDLELRALMPLMEVAEEELEAEVLAAWEQDHAQEERAERAPGEAIIFPPSEPQVPPDWRRLFRSVPLRLAYAVAACLLVFVGVRNYTSEPLQWMAPDIQSAQVYRGADGEVAEPVYSSSDMNEFVAALNKAITKSYKELGPEPLRRSVFNKRTEWIIVTKFQELREKSLYVQIEAYSPEHRTLVSEWARHFANAQSYLDQVDDFSAGVVRDLLKGTPETEEC